MQKPRVLIVENEVLVSLDISKRLERAGFEITDTVENGLDAIKSFEHARPDIVLMDIDLDGSIDGIETAALMKRIFALPFIFLTSYSDDHTFKRAQEVSPSAFLLKPFNERELHLAIQLAISNFSDHLTSESVVTQDTDDSDEHYYLLQDSIFLKNRNRFEKVLIDSITYIEADGNCTHIHTTLHKYFLSITMGTILSDLKLPNIVRCHRSYAVNISRIDSFEGNTVFVKNKGIPVSKSYKEAFFNQFKTL